MKVEFSPNLEVLDSNTENDKSIFLIDTKNVYNDNSYPSFLLSKGKIEMDEPLDQDDKFWSGFIALSGAANTAETPFNLPQTATSMKINSNINAPINNSSTLTEKQHIPSSSNSAKEIERGKVQAQIDSIQKMVTELDQQFQNKQINQDIYIKKKEYLAQKLGALYGQLEQI
jgi:hypothetical protein